MNRKQKKELRERQTTRQLMGIDRLTEHGVKTAKGELVFFMLSPDNLSVLSPEGVQARVAALANLLRTTPAVRLQAMDSRESFQANKDCYQRRLEQEPLFDFVPGVRDAEEYGKYMIQESGHFEYDPNLDNFYNYSQYGWERINREMGQFSALGYISYQGTLSLEELLCGDPVERMDQQMDGMGGMA